MAGAGLGSAGGYGSIGQQSSGLPIEDSLKLGHRMNALVRSFPTLGTDPNVMLALASAPTSDDEMFAQATNATGAAQIDNVMADLEEMPAARARAAYIAFPEAMQSALRASGYQPPDPEEGKDRGFFNIDLPDSIPFVGRVLPGGGLPDEIHVGAGMGPVGEALETVQNVGGEALEGGLELLNKPYRAVTHTYRTFAQLEERFGEFGSYEQIITNPTQFLKAWDATSNGERTFQLRAIDEAVELIGPADLEIAKEIAATGGQDFSPEGPLGDFLKEEGLEPGTPEFADEMQRIYAKLSDPDFERAVEILTDGKVSFGRDIARTAGLDPSEGLGVAVSGAFDGMLAWYSDPFLILGKARHARRAATWGLGESTTEGVKKAEATWRRVADGEEVSRIERTQAEGVGRVINLVNDAFSKDDIDVADLGRNLPQLEPEFDNMQKYHVGAKLFGEADLSTPDGFWGYLKTQAGTQALAGRRLGGFTTRQVELPHLTRADQVWLRGKRYWQETLDATLEAGRRVDDVAMEHLGLSEGVGKVIFDAAIVPMARLTHILTHHVPYDANLKLHGPEALVQFRRLAEMGVMADMPRHTIDSWFNQFANSYNPATRRLVAEKFMDDMFGRMGLYDTQGGRDWAEEFVGHARQAYGHAGRDAVGNSKYLIWPDAQHAEGMSLFNLRGADGLMHQIQKMNLMHATVGRMSNSWFDAALGRYWKPAVLLRIGFITRAAGEELLNFVLRLSPQEYAQAKFLAPWAHLTPEHQQMATFRPVLFLSDTAHRISRYYKPDSALTNRFAELDKNLLGFSTWLSGNLHDVAVRAGIPTRQAIGEALTDPALRAGALQLQLGLTRAELARMTPDEVASRRLAVYGEMMKDPVVARSFAEMIGGSTWEPLQTRDPAASLMTVLYPEGRGRTLRRVPLKLKRGTYAKHDLTSDAGKMWYASRLDHLRQDRVGRELLKVLSDYAGPNVERSLSQVARRRGLLIGDEDPTDWIRMKLTQLGPKSRQDLRDWLYGYDVRNPDFAGGTDAEEWIHVGPGDEAKYKALSDRVQKIDPDLRILVEELPDLDRRTLAWLAETGNGPRIKTIDELQARLEDVARARMHDPDMARSVRESVAANTDVTGEEIAWPVRDGFTPMYLADAETNDFVGVYDRLERELIRAGRQDLIGRIDPEPLDVAFTDPKVARAVSRALGAHTIRRVDVPDEAVRNPKNPHGLTTDEPDWHRATMFTLPDRYLAQAELVRESRAVPQVRVKGSYNDKWVDEADYIETLKAWYAGPPEGHIRLYRGQVDDEVGPAVNVRAENYDYHRQETVGMWWTNETRYAKWAVQDRFHRALNEAGVPDPQGNIYFVDVPEEEARRFWLGSGSTADPEDLAVWREQAGELPSQPVDNEWVIHDPSFITSRRQAPLGEQLGPARQVDPPPPGHTRLYVVTSDDLGRRAMQDIGTTIEDIASTYTGNYSVVGWDMPDEVFDRRLPQEAYDEEVDDDLRRWILAESWIQHDAETPVGFWEMQPGPGMVVDRAEASGASYGEGIAGMTAKQREEFLSLVAPGIRRHEVRTATPDDQEDLLETFEGLDALHEVTGPLLRGDFSIEDLAALPATDLPESVMGPELYHDIEGRWDKVVRYGFDRVLGPAISAIIREPLFVHNFAKGMRNTKWVEPMLRDVAVQDEARKIAKRVFGKPAKAKVTAGTAPSLELVAGPRLNEDMVKGLQWSTATDSGREILKDLSINLNGGRQVHLFDEDGLATDWLLDHQDEVVARLDELWQEYAPDGTAILDARETVKLAGGPAERGEVPGQVDIFDGLPGAGDDTELARLVDGWFTLPAWARDPKTGSVRVNRELAKAMGWEDPGRAAFITVAEDGTQTFDAAGYRALEQARAQGLEPPNPFDLTRTEIRTLRRYAENDKVVRETIRDTALQRAITDSIPFIDDHKVRSQFQEYVGNLIPFHFAEEQFLKRWIRSISASPELLRKAQLYMNGIRNMGFVTTNEFGEEIFVMPGSHVFTEAISKVATTLTGSDGMLPMPVPLTFQVQYMTPGFDRMGVPSFGPYVGLALNGLRRVFPELAPIEESLMGPRGSGQSLAAYFVPTQARRMYHALTDDVMEGEMHSAALEAAAYLEAHGLAPRDNASPEELETYIDRLTDHARIIGLTRAIVGFMGPTTPTISNPEDLNPEYVSLLRSGVPPSEAVGLFLERNPDANAYTIFRSESTTGGSLPATEEAFVWMEENEDYLRAFSAAAPWLIPQGDSDDAYDRRAYYDQMGRGMRIRKKPLDWVMEAKASKGADTYYDMQDEYDERMEAAKGDASARREIDQTWRTWRASWLAQHPALAARLQGDPTTANRRRETLSQMRLILNDPGVPDTPHWEQLRGLLTDWFRFSDDYNALKHDRRGIAVAFKRDLRTRFVERARAYARKYPAVSAFFNSVLRPELALLGADRDELVLT